MYTLAIESAGPLGGVALGNETEAHEIIVPLGPGRGEVLPELIKELMRQAKVSWEKISLIAVDVGPGSFTGLRVGLSLAKALAQVRGLPVVPVRQTEAVGFPLARFWPGRVCVWIHDRRDYVYMGWVEEERAGTELVLTFSEALGRVREHTGVLLAGTGAVRFAQEIKAQAEQIVLAPETFSHPRPLVVAQIGYARYTRKGPVDLLKLEPHYVQ